MVAVSVDMLTTGFDCREVLHLVLCRKIFSPILYQQIRGRGTRTAPHIGKKRFVIYDFFRNHEYFNDSETDIFEGPAGGGGGTGGGAGGTTEGPTELVELGIQDDWLDALTYVEVGPEGERVDKKNDRQLARIRNKYIGFVFQTFNLIQRTTALDNVCLPITYARGSGAKAKAMKALERVGLDARATHRPNELSG